MRSILHPCLVLCLTSLLYVVGCGSPPPLEDPDGKACQGINCTDPKNVSNNGNNTGNNTGNNANNINNTGNNQNNANNNPIKNECAAGDSECVDAAQWRTCIQDESGSYWSLAQPCEGGVCANGQCCVNGCSMGDRICGEAGIQVCELQADGCYAYDAPQQCPAGSVCGEGGICLATCTSDCAPNDIQCFPENTPAYRTCVEVEPGCYKWESAETQCQPNHLCQNNQCVEQCSHGCTQAELNKTRCENNVQTKCQVGANGCRDWNSTGQSCSVAGQAACNSKTLNQTVPHGTCVQVNYNWTNCAPDCGWGLCSNGQWYCQRSGLGACAQTYTHNACTQ